MFYHDIHNKARLVARFACLTGVLAGLCLTLPACSMIVTGDSQKIGIATIPFGAKCALYRKNRQIAILPPTPTTVTVPRRKEDLWVVCTKDQYTLASSKIISGMNNWVWGDILAGGPVGAAIDLGTGAYNSYDSQIVMRMTSLPAGAQIPALPDIWPPPQAGKEAKEKTVLSASAKPTPPIQIQTGRNITGTDMNGNSGTALEASRNPVRLWDPIEQLYPAQTLAPDIYGPRLYGNPATSNAVNTATTAQTTARIPKAGKPVSRRIVRPPTAKPHRPGHVVHHAPARNCLPSATEKSQARKKQR